MAHQTTLVQLQGKGTSPKTALYVGGLAETVTEAMLHAAFLPFGDIKDVSIPLDHASGTHRGFGFVEFELPEDAADAVDNMHNGGASNKQLWMYGALNVWRDYAKCIDDGPLCGRSKFIAGLWSAVL